MKTPNREEINRAFDEYRTKNESKTAKRNNVLWRCRINSDGLRELAIWGENPDPDIPFSFLVEQQKNYTLYREIPQQPQPETAQESPIVPPEMPAVAPAAFLPGRPAPDDLSLCVAGLLYHKDTRRGMVTFSRTENGLYLWRGLKPEPHLYGSGAASDLQALFDS